MTDPGTVEPGPAVTDGLTIIADHLEANAARLADRIVAASRAEVPEYAAMDDAARERQRARNDFGIRILASLIRNGRGTFDANERTVIAAAGREVASEPEPLHAVIRTYQIAGREMLNAILGVLPELGPGGSEAFSLAFRLGSSLLSVLIESMEVAFAEQARSGRRSAEETNLFVNDLVLGAAPETFGPRAAVAGLAPAQGYRAVVVTVVGPGQTQSWPDGLDRCVAERLPQGAVFGRLGRLGVVVVPAANDDRAYAFAAELEAVVGERTALPTVVAVGPPRHELTSFHESFEVALATATAARRAGWDQQTRRIHTVTLRMIAAARNAGWEPARIVEPLLCSDEADELIGSLRAYLRNGCSTLRAAEEMHMHRNTMRRRLQTIESILGFRVAARWPEVELGLLALDTAASRSPQSSR